MALIEMLFAQTATITPFLREGNGKPVYGPSETRRCRIERGRHLRHTYVNPDGSLDQVEAKTKMFCVGAPIPARSRVVCDGQEFMVVDCEIKNGFADNHLEVYLE